MDLRIENVSGHPVVLLLSSGETVRISPGAMSEELPESELKASAKIEKLTAEGVIAVHEPTKRSAADKAQKSTPAKAAGGGTAKAAGGGTAKAAGGGKPKAATESAKDT